MITKQYRLETDSLGDYPVPYDAYYGSQTARSVRNFSITNQHTHPMMIKALGMVKKSAAIANNKLGHIDDERLKYIKAACEEVILGKFNNQFVTDVIQGGAGTSVNMNANEVIANRANELAGHALGSYDYIHPNDHINFSQSTNDVFPTASRIALIYLVDDLIAEIKLLIHSLNKKSVEFKNVLKLGRTHLQDAVPITLGQEMKAYGVAMSRDMKRIHTSFRELRDVNMGATAVGTGINADENYQRLVVQILNDITGIDLSITKDLVDSTRHVDPLVWAHASISTFCTNLSKMCNDLRLMASGPKAGFNEINLPEKQPGSSIMPGKVNPVILEVTNQVCFQVFGNDATITKAAEAGQLELNVFEPVLIYNLIQSIEILTNVLDTLRINCIDGITANKEWCQHLVDISMGTATAFVPTIGYKKASALAKQALTENKLLKNLIIEHGLVSPEELSEILDIDEMTRPGIPGKRHKKK